MVKKYFLVLFLLLGFHAQSQSTVAVPPAPGCNILAAIDADNDGFAPFDIDWLTNVYVPGWTQYTYGYDMSGYHCEWIAPNDANAAVQGSAYAGYNNQYITSIITYVGPGPNYDDDANFWANIPNCMFLYLYAPDDDNDSDGITNADEDTNGNGNLSDDDTDGDWWANYSQPNALGTSEFETQRFTFSPNPASGLIHVESSNTHQYDFFGLRFNWKTSIGNQKYQSKDN